MESSSQTPGQAPSAPLKEELRGDAQTVTDTAKQRLQAEVDARKGTAAEQAKSVSSALETAAGELSSSPEWLRSAFQQGAQAIQRFSDTIEQKDARQLTRDVQQLARDNPGTFLAGCAAAGFAAARVLKAGVPEATQSSLASTSDSYAPYAPQSNTGGSAFGGFDPAETRQAAFAGEAS